MDAAKYCQSARNADCYASCNASFQKVEIGLAAGAGVDDGGEILGEVIGISCIVDAK
jgi:hypothetical protein